MNKLMLLIAVIIRAMNLHALDVSLGAGPDNIDFIVYDQNSFDCYAGGLLGIGGDLQLRLDVLPGIGLRLLPDSGDRLFFGLGLQSRGIMIASPDFAFPGLDAFSIGPGAIFEYSHPISEYVQFNTGFNAGIGLVGTYFFSTSSMYPGFLYDVHLLPFFGVSFVH